MEGFQDGFLALPLEELQVSCVPRFQSDCSGTPKAYKFQSASKTTHGVARTEMEVVPSRRLKTSVGIESIWSHGTMRRTGEKNECVGERENLRGRDDSCLRSRQTGIRGRAVAGAVRGRYAAGKELVDECKGNPCLFRKSTLPIPILTPYDGLSA